AVFTVVVSNAAGSVTSDKASLTVTATAVAPVITVQPAAQTVDPGKPASFSVGATGTSPLRYQWKLNGKDITDATSSSYTTPAAAMADSGAAYSVVVSNGAGTVTSSPASLTVTEAPVITTQPANQPVNPGATATFTVSATGTAPLGYQWKKNGENITGATDSSYTTPATSNGDPEAKFSVVVSNRAGTVTSSEAILSVNVPASITTQPANISVPVGQTASFSVTAAGTGPFTYQWKKAGVNVTTGSGGTTSTYTTPATAIGDHAAVFTVVVSNGAGTPVTSSNATLTVTRYSLVANASGGTYDKTECVKDNKTGLVWEGKPAAVGTRAASNTYTNFDSTGTTQKSGTTLTQTDLDATTNSVGYVKTVNASPGLCGSMDWRLPT
ncbi:MAG: hypothetical protein ORN28_00055, partial [Rhodoferax sp.]|nr:hypothetical protein [Rhodoferax sp.]